MKEWSKKWRASRKPGKQRLYAKNAPLHIKGNSVVSNLSKELRKKHAVRNIRVRKGDKVKIMTGSNKGKTGNVSGINSSKRKVYIEGFEVTRKDGTKSRLGFDASNLQIIQLAGESKKRFKQKGGSG